MASGGLTTEESGKLSLAAPEHLSEESRRLWIEVTEHYEIDAASFPVLVMFFESRDRREQAREAMKETGPIVKDRFGQAKRNPWADIERDSGTIMVRAFKSLGFDQAPEMQQRLF